jgi:hypothetical protein
VAKERGRELRNDRNEVEDCIQLRESCNLNSTFERCYWEYQQSQGKRPNIERLFKLKVNYVQGNRVIHGRIYLTKSQRGGKNRFTKNLLLV